MSDFTDGLPIIERWAFLFWESFPTVRIGVPDDEFLANRILAKVLTGEPALSNRDIVVGSIGTEAAIQNGLFDDRHKA